jgi:hypothetical protein
MKPIAVAMLALLVTSCGDLTDPSTPPEDTGLVVDQLSSTVVELDSGDYWATVAVYFGRDDAGFLTLVITSHSGGPGVAYARWSTSTWYPLTRDGEMCQAATGHAEVCCEVGR